MQRGFFKNIDYNLLVTRKIYFFRSKFVRNKVKNQYYFRKNIECRILTKIISLYIYYNSILKLKCINLSIGFKREIKISIIIAANYNHTSFKTTLASL